MGIIKRLGLVALVVALPFAASSQTLLPAFDSLGLIGATGTYNLKLGKLKQISPSIGEPKSTLPLPKDKVKVGRYMLTMLTGISVGSTESELTPWVSAGQIFCRERSFTWDVPVYFVGKRSKTTERAPDGTVDVMRTVEADWTRGGDGLILYEKDTIGAFTMTLQPNEEDLAMIKRIVDESGWVASRYKKQVDGYLGTDQVFHGFFRDKEFKLVMAGPVDRGVLLIDKEVYAIFQRESPFISFSKAKRIDPHILYKQGLTEEEKMNYLRLAVLSTYTRVLIGRTR